MTSPSAPLPPRAPLPRRAGHGARARALAALLAAVLVIALVPADPARAGGARWRWPLPPPHTVVDGFRTPEHRYGPGHRGIDIAVPAGPAQVRAVEAGTVRFRGTVAGRGVVSVLHADGLLSTYEPVHALVAQGARVEAGDVLGTVEPDADASHCPARDCLHLGARRGADYLDPLLLLGARGPSVLLPWAGPSRDGGLPSAARPGSSGSMRRAAEGTAGELGAALAALSAAARSAVDGA